MNNIQKPLMSKKIFHAINARLVSTLPPAALLPSPIAQANASPDPVSHGKQRLRYKWHAVNGFHVANDYWLWKPYGTTRHEGCPTIFAALSILRPKPTGKICNFSLWLNMHVPLATAAPLKNTSSRACARGLQNGVLWWCALWTKRCYRIYCGRERTHTEY